MSQFRLSRFSIGLFLLCFCLLTNATHAQDAIPKVRHGEEKADDNRPNLVLILVDDLGYSDLGCYGGEIETPHLDRLASKGIRFTQFYNCAKCETTRATLLSGRYYPEVENRRLKHCVTLAEAMKLAGYRTLMTGKWHMESEPLSRGFDQYFGHLSGATNFFKGDKTFRLGREPFKVPSSNFYTTDANTDYAIQFLDEHAKKRGDERQPFFLYVAHNAPHYPIQCKRKDFEKYQGKYREGWDALRKNRFARQLELGIRDQSMKLPDRPAEVPAWSSLSADQKATEEMVMEAYAGMIDCVDQNLGRLIQKLKSMKELDNTLILFLSDNGACPFQRTQARTRRNQLKPFDPDSYWTYDRGWAHACNTPFREYKQNQHEGGITTPMIAHWPQGIRHPGSITGQPAHLVDVMATFLDLAKTEYPKTYQGKKTGPPRGLSLVEIFEGRTRKPHEYLFFSFYGKNNAIRVGDWKLVNKNRQAFELYNLADDRNELKDLSQSHPQQFKRMKSRMDQVFKQVGEKIKPTKPGKQ